MVPVVLHLMPVGGDPIAPWAQGGNNVAKFIFVTGGVTSSIGKGISVALAGRLLKNRGVSVSLMKLDPYINVDPGTMSPLPAWRGFCNR